MFPQYPPDDPLVRLFHTANHHQWSAADVDWEAPVGLTPRQGVALTRLLSPVYLGEQSAMYGAASVLPELARAGETAAQLYLSSFLQDEARHFDTLSQLYVRFGHHPVALREVPEMLQYHHELRRGDRVDWVWGILISDLFARQFYQAFAKVQPEALFGRISARVLIDESRHQAFAHTYLKRVFPSLPAERAKALRQKQDALLQSMRAIHRRLRDDARALDIDGETFFAELTYQIEAHGRSIGLAGPAHGPKAQGGMGGGSEARGPWWRDIERKRDQARTTGGVRWPATLDMADTPEAGTADQLPLRRSFHFDLHGLTRACSTCAVALLCRSRVVRAAGYA